mmetsp:Transcript_8111/g.13488  ORF Transcript_8111/g.13488 Transcript_8111/m.13488 type:complete len:99 (-) Transcript_8111:198-494(-)
MLGLRRFSSISVATAKRMTVASRSTSVVQSRNFVSKSARACGGAGAHDDHEHHDHPLWENLPFGKTSTGLMVFGGAFAGVALIVFACSFQNKKQGFSK